MGVIILWLIFISPPLLICGQIYKAGRTTSDKNQTTRGWYYFLFFSIFLLLIIPLVFFATSIPKDGTRSIYSTFRQPVLLWLYPLILAFFLWLQSQSTAGLVRGRIWTSFLLRSWIAAALILALAGLQWTLSRDQLTVIAVLDGSKSIPKSLQNDALSFLDQTIKKKQPDDAIGLVVFGKRAAAEITPTTTFKTPDVKKLRSVIDPESTNLAAGLRRASSLFPEGSRKRIVLFTDGRQTEGNVEKELHQLKTRGIDVKIVELQRKAVSEVLIEKISVPTGVRWDQPFDAHVYIRSDKDLRARVRLYTDESTGDPMLTQIVDLTPGKNRVTFPSIRLRSGGMHELRAVLDPLSEEVDTLTENNSSYGYTSVATEARVLVLTGDIQSVAPLVNLLSGEKLDIDVRVGTGLPENPDEYRQYHCIVLADIGRIFFTASQLQVLESCVRDQGTGLIMIGGQQGFGAGGWLGTPVEKALPVRMDLRNKRLMPSGALCIVLHTCEFPNGNAWGRKIAKGAISVLSPRDYAGLLLFDFNGGNRWLFPLQQVANKQNLYKIINNCNPGDMPDLHQIVSMGVNGLANLQNVNLKHCIIITDGDPSLPTPAVVTKAIKNKISISSIAIYPHGGGDLPGLKNMSTMTGGRFYHVKSPKKLPLIFLKEAVTVRKNLIHSNNAGIPIGLSGSDPLLRDFGVTFPTVRKMVVTTPKPRGEMHLFTIIEGEQVPLFSKWRYGLGKSAAFTSGNTKDWAGNWVDWTEYKKFWLNLLRWACRDPIPANYTLQTQVLGDKAKVVLEGIDEEGRYINFAKLVGSAADPGLSQGKEGAQLHDLKFTMTAPGRYEAEFPATWEGAYSISVTDASDPSKPRTTVTGLVKSYSREFFDLDSDRPFLQRLESIAGDNSLSSLKTMDPEASKWFLRDLPPAQEPTDLFLLLLILVVCLFPLDVAVRRILFDPEPWVVRFVYKLGSFFGRFAPAKATQPLTAEGKPTPPPLAPTENQRNRADLEAAAAQYEAVGNSEKAQELLNRAKELAEGTPAQSQSTPSSEESTKDQKSEYMQSLFKAKRKARKDKDG